MTPEEEDILYCRLDPQDPYGWRWTLDDTERVIDYASAPRTFASEQPGSKPDELAGTTNV